jgi:hypothetical protein
MKNDFKNIICIASIVIVSSMMFLSCEETLLGPDSANTPSNNFNLLWKEFDRYYPSFTYKDINWDSLYSVYSSQLSAQISDDSLWKVISKLLYNLNDPHVYMYNLDHTRFYSSSGREDSSHTGEFNLNVIKFVYLNWNFKVAGEGNFIYGKFDNDSIGYIYISSFGGDNLWTHDIDNIVSEYGNEKAIIVDIRNNTGGTSDNANYIAEAFIDRPFSYMTLKSRNGPGHNDFSAPSYLSVKPRNYCKQYTKQIILLTNRYTASSSEVFAAVFKKLSYAIQIGDSTAGALGFSDRSFELLNGWHYNMPLGLCLSLNGESYEGIGMLPDIYVRNSKEEMENAYDRQLEYALNYLMR